jgi:predicted short-subunit dehydrogenase-like oxidoreductase (DUF2520 family)
MTTETGLKEPMGIAGTGRMAKALGALMVRSGVAVKAVGGRCGQSAEDTRRFIAADVAVPVRELPHYASHIVIAVTDSAIPEVAAELDAGGLKGGIVLHTSGAAGLAALEPLSGSGNSIGVLHPLMTVPSAEQGIQTLTGATYAYAGEEGAARWAETLIKRLGGKAMRVDPKFWPHYHAGAVMACNYLTTLVDSALELMRMAGIARSDALEAVGPILRATTENVLTLGPERALTGPIGRGDAVTIQRHLAALQDAAKDTRELYVAAGLRTVSLAERAGLDAARARKVAEALEG